MPCMNAKRSPIATKADVQPQTRIIICWWVATQIVFAMVMLAIYGGLFIIAQP